MDAGVRVLAGAQRDAASPRGFDRVAAGMVLGALALLYGPTYWDFLIGHGASYSQGHEVLILAVTAWLLVRQRTALQALGSAPAPWAAAVLLGLGLLMYLLGRTQQFLRIELLSQLPVLAALVLAFFGWAGLRRVWFPVFFMLFLVPLPYSVVLAITGPLKEWVSIIATQAMSMLGYPIGRSGVVMTVGQYQLLVAEACAGLHTMFTLEALGLLYANLMNYRSWLRTAMLGLLVVPVSFCANVVRVILLVMVTYHFGDEVGQGFTHWFAGMLLFLVGLGLIFLVDGLLGRLLPARHRT